MRKSAEIYACLCAREFPAQALLRLRPELRDKPCIVMEGEPPFNTVCSLTWKARQLGIERGMTQVEVETFSGVTVLQRSLKEEARAKEVLLMCSGCFSPRVEDCSQSSSFLCVIDIAGTTELFGPPETLARSLLARVEALGITACIAVSVNFHAAVVLAKGISARAVAVISKGNELSELAPLSLSVLDLTEDQAMTFELWGINTLGGLADLPERELISRMGQSGKSLRQLARGEAPHLFQPIEPTFALQERTELDSPVEVLDALLFVANLMLEQLILRAKARVLALMSVSISLGLDNSATHIRTVRPALPTNNRQLWLKLLHLDLEAHPPRAAVLTITLDAELGSISQVQLGLFSPQLPEPCRLEVTLARIRALVGDENVGRAILTDSHQLDGFRMEPFDISSTEVVQAAPAFLRLSIRMLRPAESTSITLQCKRPKAFLFRNQRYSVEQAYGPWRTSGEWWSTALWGYEQWDLVGRARNGATICGCLVRDLRSDQWQVVGLYD